ncbi:MAG: integron integrase [Deltaproteobacteria bacterium]|nr:integron integrase [Deltaproteobacteria bacterium]MBN2674843.1 integron integrase [Deltaproteobacteria bacterium]
MPVYKPNHTLSTDCSEPQTSRSENLLTNNSQTFPKSIGTPSQEKTASQTLSEQQHRRPSGSSHHNNSSEDEQLYTRNVIDELNIENALYGLQQAIRLKHMSLSTERAYLGWSRRFLTYCHKMKNTPYPEASDVRMFLTHLAIHDKVSASTQNQAFCALLMLCDEILLVDLSQIEGSIRAKKGTRLPVVLSQPEVQRILQHTPLKYRLLLSLIYGTGLRLSEALRLRVKDIDFELNMITVRDGKGAKDRTTLLPQSLISELQAQLQRASQFHTDDLYHNNGAVFLPHALERKYPNASREWAWQWVFPQETLSVDPRTCAVRRHHIAPKTLQRAFSTALRESGVQKHASVHTLRHSFATQLLIENVDIRQIQELLGHKHLETTMIYTHVTKGIRQPCNSPVDIIASLNHTHSTEQ